MYGVSMKELLIYVSAMIKVNRKLLQYFSSIYSGFISSVYPLVD